MSRSRRPLPASPRNRRSSTSRAKAGSASSAACPKDNPVISVDSNLVHYRELTIVGANGSSPAHNKQALELISTGAVPVADLITHRLPLDGVLDALQIVADGDGIKVTIEP